MGSLGYCIGYSIDSSARGAYSCTDNSEKTTLKASCMNACIQKSMQAPKTSWKCLGELVSTGPFLYSCQASHCDSYEGAFLCFRYTETVCIRGSSIAGFILSMPVEIGC